MRTRTAEPMTGTHHLENDIDEVPEYKIKKIVRKRFVRNRFQCFVKEKNNGMEHNTWYGIDDLGNAKKKTIANYEKLNKHFPQRFHRRNARPPRCRARTACFFFENGQPRRLTTKQTNITQRGRWIFFVGGYIVMDSYA